MNDAGLLETKFARIGARMRINVRRGRRRPPAAMDGPVRFDVGSDGEGEYFEVIGGREAVAEVEVLDVRPADRHLLLMVREEGEKHKYLCGHDERHWFVAAVPESAPVGTVRAAKEALKPAAVQVAQARAGLGSAARNRRKNAAYRRQGEWFFLPTPDLKVDERLVLRDEPIRRGNGGKPHRCDQCYRRGGVTVYVCSRYPNGLEGSEYARVLKSDPEARHWGWGVMTSNAEVFVRGRVRHADHATITLHGWHRVLMNTEHQAKAMRNVAFLD